MDFVDTVSFVKNIVDYEFFGIYRDHRDPTGLRLDFVRECLGCLYFPIEGSMSLIH